MASEDEATVYCICRQPYDGQRFMIECEICTDWFHGSCVGIQEHQASDIEIYHCPNCQPIHGPLTLKKRRNWHRHDYSETDENLNKAIQSGTFLFVQELKKRQFPSADKILFTLEDGYGLTLELLQDHAFNTPILVHRKDGLNLKVPPPNFSIQDVENKVGSMREIDVIDVARQDDYKMLMREWTEYYNSPNRLKIFNVISLEFTNTPLAELVEPPEVVRAVSWVNRFWPDAETVRAVAGEGEVHKRPQVQRYCLMGVKDSYTDFHVDFGGTSVWYHVLRGEKVFYLIQPTNANLALYETWLQASNQSEKFFGDQVDCCYKCTVKQGQTLFIPTGWIHAVLTPIDSLVFGGNFLHSLQIDRQIRCYEIEKRVKTPSKYLFPNYETLHWYALQHMSDQITAHQSTGETPPVKLLEAARSVSAALKEWTHKKEYIERSGIPITIQYGKLLKEVQKQLKPYASMMSEFDPPRGPPRNSDDEGDDNDDRGEEPDDDEDDEGEGRRKRGRGKRKGKRHSKKSSKRPKLKLKVGGVVQPTPNDNTTDDQDELRSPRMHPMLGSKDISVYDFDEDDDKPAPRSCLTMSSPTSGMSSPNPRTPPFFSSPKAQPVESPRDVAPRLKLNLTASGVSKIIGTSSQLSQSGASQSDTEEQLVVDESPQSRKHMNPAAALRLKISTNNTAAQLARGMASPASTASVEEGSVTEQRLAIDTIRGGLNGSISDILEASGYGTETEFTIDENIGRASPSMRDAIQGMLSMSQMGGRGGTGSTLGSLGRGSPFIERTKPALRLHREAAARRRNQSADGGAGDGGTGGGADRMHTAYRDDEYVYPTLDLSDNEQDHVFKPRGRQKRDDTWNPKAKLTPNCPKPERPQREGVRKTSVESQLEDAAVKMANKPTPKRQYIRKKPKEGGKSLLPPPASPSPGTSASFSPLTLSSSAPATMMKGPLNSAKAAAAAADKVKKPKKGMATAKQRLGKILKMKF